jgi:NAD/NADP transhydrogenase alpha subunit
MLSGVVKAGVLKETWPGETRVALVPGVLGALAKAGIELAVESGAGEAAGFPDGLYAEKGAVVGRRDDVLSTATLLLSVRSFAGAHDRGHRRLGPQHARGLPSTRCSSGR